jgi:hypothetical protein
MPLCRQHFATDPSTFSPVSVAVIFLLHSMQPIHPYIVSLGSCHLAAFVISHEVPLEAPSSSRKAAYYVCFLLLPVYL